MERVRGIPTVHMVVRLDLSLIFPLFPHQYYMVRLVIEFLQFPHQPQTRHAVVRLHSLFTDSCPRILPFMPRVSLRCSRVGPNTICKGLLAQPLHRVRSASHIFTPSYAFHSLDACEHSVVCMLPSPSSIPIISTPASDGTYGGAPLVSFLLPSSSAWRVHFVYRCRSNPLPMISTRHVLI